MAPSLESLSQPLVVQQTPVEQPMESMRQDTASAEKTADVAQKTIAPMVVQDYPGTTSTLDDRMTSEGPPTLVRKFSGLFRKRSNSKKSLIEENVNDNQQLSTDPFLQDKLTYFRQMCILRNYDPEKASNELAQCIQHHPDRQAEFLKLIIELQQQANLKYPDRLSEIFFGLFFIREDKALIATYFAQYPIDLQPFAQKICKKLLVHPKLAHILSLCTAADLTRQVLESPQFNVCLSSILYIEIGNCMGGRELSKFCTTISEKLKKCRESEYSLKREYGEKRLEKNEDFKKRCAKDKDFKMSSEYQKSVDSEIELNATHIVEFLKPILAEIYTRIVPRDFTKLLQIRQRQILSSLKGPSTPLEENTQDPMLLSRARKSVADLLLLGLLKPHLTRIKGYDSGPILPYLIEVLEHLVRETPFSGALSEVFNPLYHQFLPAHLELFDCPQTNLTG